MELYKLNADSAVTRKTSDFNKAPSGEEVVRVIKKGDFVFVKKTESLTDSKMLFPYTKYTLINNDSIIDVKVENTDSRLVKKTIEDVPEYLLYMVKKPKVYIVIAVVFFAWATYSIIKEQKKN